MTINSFVLVLFLLCHCNNNIGTYFQNIYLQCKHYKEQLHNTNKQT